MDSLSSLRQQIDKIDTQILKLLAERFHLVKYVAVSKLTGSKFDPEREKKMLESWLKQIEGTDLEPKFTRELLKLITSESKRFQSEVYNEE